MKNQVQKLTRGLLLTGLLGCGVAYQAQAFLPGPRPAQVPGRQAALRPAAGKAAAAASLAATVRQPNLSPAATPTQVQAAALVPAIGAPGRRIQAGRIIDEAGQPLVGATVLLKGTTRGTSTDANGDYSLPVPLGLNTFVVAYSGYQDEIAQSRDGQPLTVTLLPIPGLAPAEPAAPESKANGHLPKMRLRKALR